MKVSLAMLLKTHVEKMPENRSLAMFMKTSELKSLSGDVYEKKGSYLGAFPRRQAMGRDSAKQVFAPALIGAAHHAHNLPAGVQGEGVGGPQQSDASLFRQPIPLQVIAAVAAGDQVIPIGVTSA